TFITNRLSSDGRNFQLGQGTISGNRLTNMHYLTGAGVAVFGIGTVYVLNYYHHLYQLQGSNWVSLPGNWNQCDEQGGHLWCLGTNTAPGGYGIWAWNSTTKQWQSKAGGAEAIAVCPNGTVYVVNDAHKVYGSTTGSAWAQLGGFARDVTCTAANHVWIL